MGTLAKDDVYHQLHIHSLKDSLAKECRVMAEYAMANGKPLDPKQMAPLAKSDDELTSAELLPVYNYLLLLVKPAKPGTLILFEKNRQSNNAFKFLGPLPIIRRFMLLAIGSLLALIGFSLSSEVNATSIELSMLQGCGIDQALRLGFLLAASSVGASFYALFRMNHFINEGTFDVKYSSTYWARYVVGIVAGILLSEMFIVFINPDTIVTVDNHISGDVGLSEKGILSTTRYLLKPILAILGGFSANLVYRILNRLVETVESIFKGSAEEQVNQKQAEVLAQSEDALNQVKSSTAHQLLSLKSELINKGVSPDMLSSLDDVTGSLVPTLTGQIASTADTGTEKTEETEPEKEEASEAPEPVEPQAPAETNEGSEEAPPKNDGDNPPEEDKPASW